MKILAISSAGGHWEQLIAIRECFAGHEVVYANTLAGLAERSAIAGAAIVHDCNRNDLRGTLKTALDTYRLVRAMKPDVVVTTGAGPGLLALIFGKLSGAHAIWIDSVANSERLSLSGRLALWIADLHLTQWEHLASPRGPKYLGSVL